MTAAALEISYLDPVIPDKKTYLLWPGHVDMEVCEEGSKSWSSRCIHKNSLVSIHSGSRKLRLRADTAFGRGGIRHRVTGPSRRMTRNVAPHLVGPGTTGFALGGPYIEIGCRSFVIIIYAALVCQQFASKNPIISFS
jgi:hypothetical protein